MAWAEGDQVMWRSRFTITVAGAVLLLGIAGVSSASASPQRVSARMLPLANGPGTAECGNGNTSAFAYAYGWIDQCLLPGSGPVDWANGSLHYLANSSGLRVWFHQNPDGSGWAECYSNNNWYVYSGGGPPQEPGNMQISFQQCANADLNNLSWVAARVF
jgi:hypothetical protein